MDRSLAIAVCLATWRGGVGGANASQRSTSAGQQTPQRTSRGEIEHVVVLMQENRSFDHYYGTLAGVRGFDAPDALKLMHGKSVFHQPDSVNSNGYMLPFHLDTQASSAQKIPSTSHAWAVQHAAWNGGKMDQWLRAHRDADGVNGPYVMGYYKRGDIPFHSLWPRRSPFAMPTTVRF